jgi:hypothetical protein
MSIEQRGARELRRAIHQDLKELGFAKRGKYWWLEADDFWWAVWIDQYRGSFGIDAGVFVEGEPPGADRPLRVFMEDVPENQRWTSENPGREVRKLFDLRYEIPDDERLAGVRRSLEAFRDFLASIRSAQTFRVMWREGKLVGWPIRVEAFPFLEAPDGTPWPGGKG